MASNKRPIIRLTKVDLTNDTEHNPELRDKLDMKFMGIQAERQDRNRLQREAQASVARYQQAAARVLLSENEFFLLAADASNDIATEEGCMPPYIDKTGHLCVDIPFTQREQRLAVQVAHNQLQKQAEDVDPEMFDDGGDDGSH